LRQLPGGAIALPGDVKDVDLVSVTGP
jgi:hypothetical protein